MQLGDIFTIILCGSNMKIVVIAGILILILFVLQFVLSGLYGFITPVHHAPKTENRRKFIILIPARNEEMVLGNLLSSLEHQNYPKDRYEICVIANGCTDSTEHIVKEHGCSLISMKQAGSKGEVLAHAFHILQSSDRCDAYVVFDADNIVAPDFLSAMNESMQEGYEIIQGRRTGKNSRDNLISSIYELFYMMQNIFFNHTRMCIHSSAILNGTGWAVSARWIRKHGFPVKTMTEDLELSALACLTDTVIGYCHDACTYDEFPNTFSKQLHQLQRWVYGQVECLRIYEWKLLRKSCFCSFARDLLLVFLTPVLVLAVLLFLLAGLLFLPETWLILFLKHNYRILLIILYVMVIVVAIMETVKSRIPVSSMFPAILVYPLFFLLWIPFAVVSLFRRSCRWLPVRHDRSIRIEDLK